MTHSPSRSIHDEVELQFLRPSGSISSLVRGLVFEFVIRIARLLGDLLLCQVEGCQDSVKYGLLEYCLVRWFFDIHTTNQDWCKPKDHLPIQYWQRLVQVAACTTQMCSASFISCGHNDKVKSRSEPPPLCCARCTRSSRFAYDARS